MNSFVRTSNALLILVLMGVISAAFFQEFAGEGPPCPLCFLQRLGMIGIATGAFMNLRLGVKIRHYALSLLSTGIGGAVSVRQILLHICKDFPEFGYPVLGYELYTWAFIVFCCSAASILFLIFLYKPDQAKQIKMNGFEKFALFSLVLITVANIALTINLCGFGPCEDIPWPPNK